MEKLISPSQGSARARGKLQVSASVCKHSGQLARRTFINKCFYIFHKQPFSKLPAMYSKAQTCQLRFWRLLSPSTDSTHLPIQIEAVFCLMYARSGAMEEEPSWLPWNNNGCVNVPVHLLPEHLSRAPHLPRNCSCDGSSALTRSVRDGGKLLSAVIKRKGREWRS